MLQPKVRIGTHKCVAITAVCSCLLCLAGHAVHAVEISPEATPAEAAAARALHEKYGGPRFFGYSGHDPKVLHLVDPKLTNGDIAPLGRIVSLEEVFLAGLAIDDEGLAPLAGLNKLRSLSLSGTAPNAKKRTMSLTGEGFAWLAMLPNLEKIWLRDLPVEAEHVANLSRIQGLKELWISERATLNGPRGWIADESVDALLSNLKDIKGLETFRLQTSDKTATAAAFAQWKSAATLKKLELEGVAIDRAGWVSLREFTAIESLRYHAPVDDIDWKSLAKLPNLCHVHLNFIDDEALEGIRQCQQIRELHLGSTITDAGLRHVTEMPHLESLTLWHSRIDGSGFADVKNLTGLKMLRLEGTQLNDDGLQHVVRLPALEQLSFERTRVTPEGMKVLLQAKATLKDVTPTLTKYEIGSELRNPYYRMAEEIKKSAPEMKFRFAADIPP